MGIVIDFLILLIILICTFIGYKRGLVKVVVGLLAFVIALVASVILYKPISNLIIEKTNLDDNIQAGIYEEIKGEDIEKSDNGIIEFANQYLVSEMKEVTAELISESITETIIEVITFIILLILIRIVLIFASAVFGLIAELPIIKQFNKAGGTIYGILQGIIINYIIFAIIIVGIQIAKVDKVTIDNTIGESKIGSVLYNDNIIIKLLK